MLACMVEYADNIARVVVCGYADGIDSKDKLVAGEAGCTEFGCVSVLLEFITLPTLLVGT